MERRYLRPSNVSGRRAERGDGDAVWRVRTAPEAELCSELTVGMRVRLWRAAEPRELQHAVLRALWMRIVAVSEVTKVPRPTDHFPFCNRLSVERRRENVLHTVRSYDSL